MLKISKKQILTFSLLAFVFLLLASSGALAETPTVEQNAMVDVLCNALKLVTGGIGKTIAAFVIIALGVGFFGGKVSYAAMIAVTLGIAAMFGAPAIVNLITGSDTVICEE